MCHWAGSDISEDSPYSQGVFSLCLLLVDQGVSSQLLLLTRLCSALRDCNPLKLGAGLNTFRVASVIRFCHGSGKVTNIEDQQFNQDIGQRCCASSCACCGQPLWIAPHPSSAGLPEREPYIKKVAFRTCQLTRLCGSSVKPL